MEKGFTIYRTYFTEDGCVDGEYGEDSYTDEDSHPCEPDFYDLLDGDSAVFLAVNALLDAGITQDNGHWYSYIDGSYITNYATGERCDESWHPVGFNENEQNLIGWLMGEHERQWRQGNYNWRP